VPAGQRVLVVDGLAETEQVLRAVLEPRGLAVDRVRRAQVRPDDLVRRCPPHVVVLHLDDAPAEGAGTASKSSDAWANVPRVLIGETEASPPARNAGEHFLEKPFQYGELIQAIERLLASAT
jgi:DNA-binding NtrC family response regulator